MDIYCNRLDNLLKRSRYFPNVIGVDREDMLNAYIEIATELDTAKDDSDVSVTLTTTSRNTPEMVKLIQLLPCIGLHPSKGTHKDTLNEFISDSFLFLAGLDDYQSPQNLKNLVRDNSVTSIFSAFSQMRTGKRGAKSTFIGEEFSEDHFAGLIYSFLALKADYFFNPDGSLLENQVNQEGLAKLEEKIHTLQFPRKERTARLLER